MSTAIAACGGDGNKPASSKAQSGTSASGIFKSEGSPKFVLVNHVTTNPFFVPTRYGAEDACKLLGCSYQFTGSKNSNVNEMVNAFNTAVTSGADGIACLPRRQEGVQPAHRRGAEGQDPRPRLQRGRARATRGWPTSARTCSPPAWRWASGSRVSSPPATSRCSSPRPGQSNIQPRIDGALSVLRKVSGIKTHVITTGAELPAELSVIDSYAQSHPDTKGYFAVDAGSTQGLAQTIQKQKLRDKGVKGGGYDLTPVTQKLLAADQIDFTIDQQPYLQGFFPIMELYLAKASGTLSGVADVNTGLKFLDKTTVVPYNSTKSRYEGTSSSPGVAKA